MLARVLTQRGRFSETVVALVDGARTGIGRQPEPGLGAHDSTPHQEHLVRFVILDRASCLLAFSSLKADCKQAQPLEFAFFELHLLRRGIC